jgi:hypothetical protein
VANELPLDRNDVVTMMAALFDIRSDVERVVRLLEEDDEEEEEDCASSRSGSRSTKRSSRKSAVPPPARLKDLVANA